MNQKKLTVLVLAASAAAVAGSLISAAEAQKDAPRPRYSLNQAKQVVSMLNDLYVNAVVVTHNTYVKDPGTPAAAAMARRVFKAMEEKGWPTTRWISTTGRPMNPDAAPRDQFEKDAVDALKKGQARFERVEGEQLRVATLIPLVDKSCQICHSKDKVGDPVGGLSYTVNLAAPKAK